jgi:hypothetical protein
MDYENNPLFEVIEVKTMNNIIEAECPICVFDGIGEFSGLSKCKIGFRPEIVWDESRNRAVFYCEKFNK